MQLKTPVSVTLSELLTLSRQAKALSVTKGRSAIQSAGPRLSKMLGRGMEFSETRPYQQGDDLRAIDWRVTARTGKPHTKLFTEEKEREVHVLVDFRSPMFFGTRGVFKSVQASLLAGLVSLSGMHEGNRVGGVLFDEASVLQLRPGRGKKGAMPLLNALSERAAFSQKKWKNPGEGKMQDALKQLVHRTRPGSVLFLISDFRNTPESFEEALCQLARHSTVFLCFIYDPLEADLPKNLRLSVAGVNGEKEIATLRKNVEKYQGQFFDRKRRVEALARYRTIHVIDVPTEEECFSVLSRYFRKP